MHYTLFKTNVEETVFTQIRI